MQRAPHRDDRRVRVVSATVEGHRVATRGGELLGGPPEALRVLPAAELAALERLRHGGGGGPARLTRPAWPARPDLARPDRA